MCVTFLVRVCVRVRVCACACVRVRVQYARVCACVCVRVRPCVCVCGLLIFGMFFILESPLLQRDNGVSGFHATAQPACHCVLAPRRLGPSRRGRHPTHTIQYNNTFQWVWISSTKPVSCRVAYFDSYIVHMESTKLVPCRVA